jgi:hypothetical protein
MASSRMGVARSELPRTKYLAMTSRLHDQRVAVPGEEKTAHQCREVGAVPRRGSQQVRRGLEEPCLLAITLSQTEKEGQGQTLAVGRR